MVHIAPRYPAEIACAQLCGLSHYRMRGYLTIDSEKIRGVAEGSGGFTGGIALGDSLLVLIEMNNSSNRWLHRFACLLAFATFLLICAGGERDQSPRGFGGPGLATTYGRFHVLLPDIEVGRQHSLRTCFTA